MSKKIKEAKAGKAKKVTPVSQLMVALSIFGEGNINKWFSAGRRLLSNKTCLKCGTQHKHHNSFCTSLCCHSWRLLNPQKGKLGRYHHPKTGEVKVEIASNV